MRTRIVVPVVLGIAAAFLLGISVAGWSDVPWSNPPAQVVAPLIKGPIEADTFRQIAAARMPAVVNIRTESRRQTRDLSDFFEPGGPFEHFFGAPAPQVPREQITESAGSGFLIDEKGLILTNNHVVDGATRITVALYAENQGEEHEARVVGRDPLTDSALIELIKPGAKPFPVAALGKSADVRPGDWVMAVGNPFNLAHTVTVGVISAIDRPFPVSESRWADVLQTDAAINPGNSGGPLLNLRGEVIGINTAIIGGPTSGNVGVGFAMPIDAVRELLPELRRGTVTRGRLGVAVTPVTADLAKPLGLAEAAGALVRSVDRGGPAAEAGILPGDVIRSYNNQRVQASDDLVRMVSRTKPGTAVPIDIVRDGSSKTMNVTIGTLSNETETGNTRGSAESFGITLRDLAPDARARLKVPKDREGVLVSNVDPGGPAARAGIRAGDVVLEVNRQPASSATDALAALRQDANQTALMLLWRNGQELFVTMSAK